MKNEVLFVILEDYADWESAYLSTEIKRFSEGKIEIKTVSNNLNPVTTIGGFRTMPDYTFDTAPNDFLSLFLIGGNSWKKEQALSVLPLIEITQQKEILLGGICAASEFLATKGFLNTVKHTSNGINSIKSWDNSLYNNEQNYINEQAVLDKNILTANGTATLEFAEKALIALKIADYQKIYEWYAFQKYGLISALKNQA